MQFVKIFFLLNLGAALSAPNHLKAAVLDNNEIPNVSIGGGGVSASWGGYSAKAGLGGNAGVSGGLFASADSPHGNAAAGLAGNVGAGNSASGVLGASASSANDGSVKAGLGGNTGVSGGLFASADSPHGNAAAGLAGSVGTPGTLGTSYVGATSTANAGTTYMKDVTIRGGSLANSGGSAGVGGSGSYASSGASAGTISTDGHTQVIYNSNNKPGGLFDNIFNIPISVLQAVNGLLNQQGGHASKTVHVHGHSHGGAAIDNRNMFTQSSNSAGAAIGTVYDSKPLPGHQVSVAETGGAAGSVGATVTVQKRPVNFDNIFNIPISALTSVNQLLNG